LPTTYYRVGYDVKVIKKKQSRLRGAERRLKLIEAAVEVFSKKGYENATMDEIAAQGFVTKPVLYDHFKSKEAIFVAAAESTRDDLLTRGQRAIAKERTYSKRLQVAISTFFEFVEDQPGAARFLMMSSKPPAPVADICRQLQAQATMGIAALMRSNARATSNSSSISEQQWFLKAEFTKKGMHGLAEWWLDHPDVSRAEVEMVIFEVLSKGAGLR